MYWQNVLSRRVIIHLRGQLMRQTHGLAADYIAQRREDQGRSDLYASFERLVSALDS